MTLAIFLLLSCGLGYGVYRLIVWQAHESARRQSRPPSRVTDAVVTDAVVTDAVVTDAVVDASPSWDEARGSAFPEPPFVLDRSFVMPDSLVRSLQVIGAIASVAFLLMLAGAAFMVLSFCNALGSMG